MNPDVKPEVHPDDLLPTRTWVLAPNVGNVLSVSIQAKSEAEARRILDFILRRATEWGVVACRP